MYCEVYTVPAFQLLTDGPVATADDHPDVEEDHHNLSSDLFIDR